MKFDYANISKHELNEFIFSTELLFFQSWMMYSVTTEQEFLLSEDTLLNANMHTTHTQNAYIE